MDMFGGKLMNGVMSLVVLFVTIVMAGIMAGPIGSLNAYFDNAAEVTSGASKGEKFKRIYLGVSGDSDPTACQINTDTQRAGGAGATVTGTAGAAPSEADIFTATACGTLAKPQVAAATSSTQTQTASVTVYNEQGTQVGSLVGTRRWQSGASTAAAYAITWNTGIVWKAPPKAYGTLGALNLILVTVLALAVVIGIILKTKNAYQGFQQSSGYLDVGKGVLMEIGTTVVAVIGVRLTPTLLTIFHDNIYVYISGQFDFTVLGTVLTILVSLVPPVALTSLAILVSGAPVASVRQAVGSRIGGRFGRRVGMMGRRRMSY